MTSISQDTAGTALVDGVDIDAVAAVVRGCAGVSALESGPFGEVASYLPGRTVPGVAVDDGRVRVQVRSQWGVPATDLAALIAAELAPLTGTRPVDVAIADIDDPSAAQLAGVAAGTGSPLPGPGLPPGLRAADRQFPQPGGER